MTLAPLDNLVKIGQLKVEPPDTEEFTGMVGSAKRRLHDSQIEELAEDSKFSLAYGAAHALALAALRWHGYRSENRYLVLQCYQFLGEQHQIRAWKKGLSSQPAPVFEVSSNRRNAAEPSRCLAPGTTEYGER